MGKNKQSPGRGGRGRGGGQVEGNGGRGRGRGRGRSRGGGREKMHSAHGMEGMTSEGPYIDSRHQFSGHRRGSLNRAGATRPAQNPFTFVSFDYAQLDRRREGATNSADMISLPKNVSTAASDREVVVPATEGRVEVFMDRRGYQEAFEALDSEIRTAGLGFVDQEAVGCTNRGVEEQDSRDITDLELNCSEDRDVAVAEALKVDEAQDDCIHTKASGDGTFRSSPRTKKNRRGISIEGRNAGYLTVGGLKIFTEAGITFSDESEDLDEEFDARLEPYSSSDKNRRKQAKRGSRVHQRGQWLEDTFSGSGESIVDSSDSDVDDDLVEDYMANAEGADEMLDASWLLKMQHVAVEDMGADESMDGDEDSASTETSDSDSSDSDYASAERVWRSKRRSTGKESLDIDDDGSDSELEDMAEKTLFGGSNVRPGRKAKTSSLMRNLELEDSEDSEDGDDVDQFFDLMEDENFMPDKIPKTPGSGKQTIGSIGRSIQPAAWPLSVHKSKKKSKKFPGQKKCERKEIIAAKRQKRALRRGLDLQAVNAALEDIVVCGTDIYAFAPMEDRDRAQIHRMAAIYRLKSSSQGSGKKRFTVVTRTKHTNLPTGADKYRLAAMLDLVDGNSSIPLTGEDRRVAKKLKKAAHQAFLTMQTPTPKKNSKKKQNLMQGEGFLRKSMSKKDSLGPKSNEKNRGTKVPKLRAPKYANHPMSFISCGTIGDEEESVIVGLGASVNTEMKSFSVSERGEASSSRSVTVVKMKVAASTMPSAIGTFEAHTKGFGSRIMSKMGFVEGQGLGRDGQGINNPLEAVKRPKSLGLGAYAPPPTT